MADTATLAGRGRRLVATFIDMLVVPLVSFLVLLVTGAFEDAEAYAINQIVIRGFLLGVLGYLLVNGWLLYARGQTLGKAIVGITIVSNGTSNQAPFWKLVVIRALFFPTLYVVFFFPLTLIAIVDQAFIFGKQRRCLHDLVCGTSVVERPKSA
ncbi:MAG: RDD family protein [Gammaproteobacteria bacterium]|nr:RDD family protein [Gammaproteobacteria bacterium]